MKPTGGLCLFVIGFLVLQACHSEPEPAPDPRVGELKHVRYAGGGGCSSSTALAVGSTARMTLEPQGGTKLPVALAVGSTAPDVITATAGQRPGQLVLHASGAGKAAIELRDNGALYDRLAFSAEPAQSVEADAPAAVIADATFVVKINAIYGACGKDCPLIGGEFLTWSADPKPAFTLIEDRERVASFRATGVGQAKVSGVDPATGLTLVNAVTNVIAPDMVTVLTASAAVMTPDQKVTDPVALPLSTAKGSLFMIKLSGDSSGAAGLVPIAGRDIVWAIGGTPGAVTVYLPDDPPPPEGPIFLAAAPGQATLHGSAAVVGKSVDAVVTVTP